MYIMGNKGYRWIWSQDQLIQLFHMIISVSQKKITIFLTMKLNVDRFQHSAIYNMIRGLWSNSREKFNCNISRKNMVSSGVFNLDIIQETLVEKLSNVYVCFMERWNMRRSIMLLCEMSIWTPKLFL